jgi:hypothetical protein
MSVDPYWPLLNAYLYADNSPSTLIDPTGFLTCEQQREDCGQRAELVVATCNAAANARKDERLRDCKKGSRRELSNCQLKAYAAMFAELAACVQLGKGLLGVCDIEYLGCVAHRKSRRAIVNFGAACAAGFATAGAAFKCFVNSPAVQEVDEEIESCIAGGL